MLLEPAVKPVAAPWEGAQHVTFERDRIGEALLGDVARQGLARRDRFLVVAPALIEPPHQLRPEARGEHGPRAVEEIGNVLEAALRQQGHDFGHKAQDRKSTRLNSSHLGISYA